MNKTQLTPTEIESLRIAIATEMGWTSESGVMVYDGTDMPWTIWRFKGGESQNPNKVPPYTTSLDAIQAAAMERFKLEREKLDFGTALLNQRDDCYKWQLSALDWCIAFARTAKIWKNKPLNETNPPRV